MFERFRFLRIYNLKLLMDIFFCWGSLGITTRFSERLQCGSYFGSVLPGGAPGVGGWLSSVRWSLSNRWIRKNTSEDAFWKVKKNMFTINVYTYIYILCFFVPEKWQYKLYVDVCFGAFWFQVRVWGVFSKTASGSNTHTTKISSGVVSCTNPI